MADRRRRSDASATSKASSFSVVSQPLGSRREVGLAAYALLFSEMVQYCRSRVQSTTGLEQKLNEMGFRIGRRALELVAIREKTPKRETRLLGALTFVFNPLWKFLFGKLPDMLRKVSESEAKYYIEERDPLVNTYISIPEGYGSMNCAAFVAGIIAGVLDSAGFPAKVNAYSKELPDRAYPPLTIYYIEFEDEVLAREKRMK